MWKKVSNRLYKLSNNWSNEVIILSLIMIFAACSWSLFRPGIGFTHDNCHGARILEMAIGICEGQLPVIWSQNFGFGYGMPLFSFYAPLPFFIGALFHLIGLDIIMSVKMIYIICNLGTLLGSYFLGRKLTGSKWAAILCSAAITLAPYRAVDLFVRGALSESWAIMALPWILYGACLVIDRARRGWMVLSLSLVVLMLSHNLSVIICVPFLIIFALFYFLARFNWTEFFQTSNKKLRWKNFLKKGMSTFLRVSMSYLLAAGLSAFYLIPAFFEKDLTQVKDMVVNDYYDFRLHFIYPEQFFLINWGYGGSCAGPKDGMSFFLGVAQLICIAPLCAFTAFYFKKKLRVFFGKLQTNGNLITHQLELFWLSLGTLLLLAFGLFMSLIYSKPIWELFSGIMCFFQFPWRFLSISLIFAALVIVLLYCYIPRIWRQSFFICFFGCLLTNAIVFQSRRIDKHSDLYYENPAQTKGLLSSHLFDYFPRNFSIFNFPPYPDIHLIPDDLNEKVKIITDRAHEKVLVTNFPDNTESIYTMITLNLANYPFWEYRINGQLHPELLSENEQGLVTLGVPSGEQRLSIKFVNTPVRFVSNLITVISIFVLILCFFSSCEKLLKTKKYKKQL